MPFVLVVGDGHLDPVVRVVRDPRFDVVAVAIEHAGGDGDVLLEHLARLELHAQVAVGLLVLGDQDDAAGVAVEPVDDARPVVAVQLAEIAAKWNCRALTSVPVQLPLAGCTTMSCGLLMTAR